MATAAQATAAPSEIRLGGLILRMKPFTDSDISELDNWLRALVIRTARESLPDDASQEDRLTTIEAATRAAMGMSWMSGQGARMMATLDGLAQLVWQSVHHHHPTVTPADIRKELLDPDTIEEARLTLKRVNEAKSSGNSQKKTRKGRKGKRRKGSRV